MLRLIGRRLPVVVATLLCVSFLTFMLTSLLPGDPARSILGEQASDEAVAAVREDLHLDDPLPSRYVRWLGDAVQGDLGRSFRTNEPVLDTIAERAPVTLEIGLLATAIALLVAVPLAAISAWRVDSKLDRTIMTATFGMQALPSFVVALGLIVIVAVRLDWLPATGWVRLTDDLGGNLKTAILPALAMAAGECAVFTRIQRADLITTLEQDSITMARSKGISSTRILFRHALRPSMFSLLTVVGVQIGAILSGAVVVETLFALPGVGRLLVDSISQRDLMVVQGLALLVAASFVIVNFLVDIAYGLLDPRVRENGGRRRRGSAYG